jgi:hypothetical protein
MSEARVPARSVLFLQAKPGMRDELVEVFAASISPAMHSSRRGV